MKSNAAPLSALIAGLLFSAAALADPLPVFQIVGTDGGAHPTALSYSPTTESNADNCEFYVNAFGSGGFSVDGASASWYDIYVSVDTHDLVDQQGGQILNVGVYELSMAVGQAPEELNTEALYLGSLSAPAYYYLPLTFFDDNTQTSARSQVLQLAFFVDVKRASGNIDRLWLKNGGVNFTPAGILGGFATVTQSLGDGDVDYLTYASGSPVFNQRKSCAK